MTNEQAKIVIKAVCRTVLRDLNRNDDARIHAEELRDLSELVLAELELAEIREDERAYLEAERKSAEVTT